VLSNICRGVYDDTEMEEAIAIDLRRIMLLISFQIKYGRVSYAAIFKHIDHKQLLSAYAIHEVWIGSWVVDINFNTDRHLNSWPPSPSVSFSAANAVVTVPNLIRLIASRINLGACLRRGISATVA
jgi:hypothetical protein